MINFILLIITTCVLIAPVVYCILLMISAIMLSLAQTVYHLMVEHVVNNGFKRMQKKGDMV